MANYNQTLVSGAKWLRAKLVSVMNEYGEMPKITFTEEEVMQVDGSSGIIKLTGYDNPRPLLTESFSQPDEVFDLLNPDTDEVVGQAKYADIRTMLYSMYRHLAAKRDAAPAPAETPVYVPPADAPAP